ncbi:MAG: DUF4376 domain-containing protein [Proteobacteria bacterium]|nr:DUF4376 domain-containing protein [Pseudomonadota bacterium]
MNTGQYSRLDTDRKTPLEGHGVYPLSGDDLTDYNQRLADAAANALPEAQARKVIELEAVRHENQYADVVFNSVTYNAGKVASNNLTAMVTSFNFSTKTEDIWLDINNAQVTLTEAEFQGLFDTILAAQKSAYVTEAIKYAEIMALTDVVDVENYDVRAGW